ncbi:zinc ribbon domain-containing protein [Romboutsia sp. CE17]|uniref:zinc ribbon domain-containing protein n=1 Tax=Romboutsia sp. CE17 TaxID=2724150 RepID=UPI001442A8C1|nr:zinc ribbon domain-containing protein [Romboutsia sp. CE17]QJA08098.1 zinc ribbon domain-containing protein [Romboutsia sp. CE17]
MDKISFEKKIGKQNFKEKANINILINEHEDKKSVLLTELGILTYKKIREGCILDKDFDEISDKILECDKIIYKNIKELEKINNSNKVIECECGNKLNNNDKFCSVCGKNIEELKCEETIICGTCNLEIDIDSNYCVCCGKKLR